MLRVGLTGGMASGKSTVDQMLVELGARLIDSDQLARQAVAPGSPALAEIAAAFGPEMIRPDGGLDRGRMRRLAFGDAGARRRLNAIIHPRIIKLIDDGLERLEAAGPGGVAVVDLPLLFEAGGAGRFDCTVLVYAPRQLRLARLMDRDGCGRAQAEQALAAQMPLEDKKPLADFLVDNSRGLDETHRQVKRLWQRLGELAQATYPRP